MMSFIAKTISHLQQGKIILYPTDTVWGLGCDACNKDAISKLIRLKNRPSSKSFICLVSSLEMLKFYIPSIPPIVSEILQNSSRPTTIIYSSPNNLASNLIAEDNSVGIRVVPKGELHSLIQYFGKPIVSTSANLSGDPTPNDYKEIREKVLKGVDYIVPLPFPKKDTKPSRIVKIINHKSVQIIRD